MSVTLESLRSEWAERSHRLDERLRLGEFLLREQWIEGQRERVRRTSSFGPGGMAFWILTMVLLGVFLARNASQPALFVTALILDAWVIAAGVTAIRQQQALRNLDYGQPLVALQAQVEALRIARIHAFNWQFLTGQVVWWIPFAVVLAKGLFGVNLYGSDAFVTFAAWNIAAGIAFIPIAIGLSRRYGDRLSKASGVRHIANSIAGRDIAVAREYLERLRRFESGAS